MAREKKVSVNELEKAIGDVRPSVIEAEWNGLKFLVKERLTFEEMMTFVHIASDLCFGENERYRPEIKEFSIRHNIIDRYTNLRMPENTEKEYQIVYAAGLIDTILQHVNLEQYNDIIEAVNLKIKDRIQANHNIIRQKTDELIHSVESAVSAFGEIFHDIDSDKMNAVVASLAANGVDENKIVQAYMNIKQDSDA